ncbi:hypothetical protein cco65_09113 [Campylobacter coli 1957]|nr:hypothetical protein cco65_09113 [Campylobacter coli 1957]
MCIIFALKTRYNRILRARFLLLAKIRKSCDFLFQRKN